MKKMMVVVMMMVMMMSVASAESLYWNEYNQDQVTYMVCGYDKEEKVAFNAVVDIIELERLAAERYIFSAFAIDVDGMYEVEWDWSEDGFIFYVIDFDGCEVEYIDFLPEIHQ